MEDIGHFVQVLESFYGTLPSPPSDPFSFFVWDVLSVQATPRRAEAALAALRRLRALTPDAMHRAPAGKIQAAVGDAGPHLESRLAALRAGVDVFRRVPDLPRHLKGTLGQARRILGRLPRLGEAGPHRMLLFAGNRLVFPVDARVYRVLTRLTDQKPGEFTPSLQALRRAVESSLPPSTETYRRTFLYLSHHGASTCTDDPHCSVCPLAEECAEGLRRRAAATGNAAGARARRTPASTG